MDQQLFFCRNKKIKVFLKIKNISGIFQMWSLLSSDYPPRNQQLSSHKCVEEAFSPMPPPHHTHTPYFAPSLFLPVIDVAPSIPSPSPPLFLPAHFSLASLFIFSSFSLVTPPLPNSPHPPIPDPALPPYSAFFPAVGVMSLL